MQTLWLGKFLPLGDSTANFFTRSRIGTGHTIGDGHTAKKISRLAVDNRIFCSYNILVFISHAPLAQLVEHLTLNQGVRGSSPRWRTR
jgi:hypothetical protein